MAIGARVYHLRNEANQLLQPREDPYGRQNFMMQPKRFPSFGYQGYHDYHPQITHSMQFADHSYSSQFHLQNQSGFGKYCEMMPQNPNEFYQHQNPIKNSLVEEGMNPNKAFSFTSEEIHHEEMIGNPKYSEELSPRFGNGNNSHRQNDFMNGNTRSTIIPESDNPRVKMSRSHSAINLRRNEY